MKQISIRFDFEIRYLGVDGMSSWLEESLATRDSVPPGDKFLYDDDVGILDMFRIVGPKLTPAARSIFISSLEQVLSNSSLHHDSFFLFAASRLLEGIGCESDCATAYELLASKYDSFLNRFDFSHSPNSTSLSDLADYRDGLEFCLDSAFELMRTAQDSQNGWIEVSHSNADISDQLSASSLWKNILALVPILRHAELKLRSSTPNQQYNGLNVANMPLVMLSTLHIACNAKSPNDVERQVEPLMQKVEASLQSAIKTGQHDEIEIFPDPENMKIQGPYNLHNFRQNMRSLFRQLGGADKRTVKLIAHGLH